MEPIFMLVIRQLMFWGKLLGTKHQRQQMINNIFPNVSSFSFLTVPLPLFSFSFFLSPFSCHSHPLEFSMPFFLPKMWYESTVPYYTEQRHECSHSEVKGLMILSARHIVPHCLDLYPAILFLSFDVIWVYSLKSHVLGAWSSVQVYSEMVEPKEFELLNKVELKVGQIPGGLMLIFE